MVEGLCWVENTVDGGVSGANGIVKDTGVDMDDGTVDVG